MRRQLEMQMFSSSNSKRAKNQDRASSSLNAVDIEYFSLKSKLNALVVDDNYVSRVHHTILLNNLGVKCRDVGSGQDAVALCRAGAAFNLILVDMEMPIMSGPEATRMLREIGVRSKIIGVTDHNREWQVREFIAAGLDDYLEKPLTYVKLIPVLREIDNSLSATKFNPRGWP